MQTLTDNKKVNKKLTCFQMLGETLNTFYDILCGRY